MCLQTSVILSFAKGDAEENYHPRLIYTTVVMGPGLMAPRTNGPGFMAPLSLA